MKKCTFEDTSNIQPKKKPSILDQLRDVKEDKYTKQTDVLYFKKQILRLQKRLYQKKEQASELVLAKQDRVNL